MFWYLKYDSFIFWVAFTLKIKNKKFAKEYKIVFNTKIKQFILKYRIMVVFKNFQKKVKGKYSNQN